jgi:riboflavin biosynthesis pyrimidine reductase
MTNPEIEVLVVTTDEGAQQAHAVADDQPNVRVLSTSGAIDYVRLAQHVREEYGVATLLSEAGPNIYGGLLAAGVVDDEFVTLSPIVVGGSDEKPRPSLIEGVAFNPDHPPRSRLLTLRRSGDFLFLQSRYTTNDAQRAPGPTTNDD